MGSNNNAYSKEPYRGNTFVFPEKDGTSKMGEHSTSKHGNLVSENSNNDSFLENLDSKASLRTSNVSGASVDVEISPKLSSGEIFRGKNHSLQPECFTSKNFSTNKFDDPRGLEGHDDNVSSVNGAEKASKFSSSRIQNTDRIDVSRASASVDSLAAEIHEKGDQFQTPLASPDLKNDVEGSRNMSNQNRSNEDEECDVQKPFLFNSDDIESRKVSLDGVNGDNFLKNEKLEVATKNDSGDLPLGVLNCIEQSQVDLVAELLSLPDADKTSMPSHHVDESDESDIVEQDVKVCDICGDAGREDLLAICCRCSDGAEHTYCMRERMDKVPEGDWLCEECKFNVEIGTRKQDIVGTENGAEKDQSSGKVDSEIATVSVKIDAKGADVEGNRPNKGSSSAKVSGKRRADDVEVPSSAKRQALESVIGSPKPANYSRLHTLSRESSFKNIDNGRVKPAQQFTSGMYLSSDSSEAARSPTTGQRSQTSGGGFIKSNSFNFSTKPKVKLVDEVPWKKRSSKESTSHDAREGGVRGIGKSLSFKFTNTGRFSTSESKAKMLSPKFSHVQEFKGLKHTNEKSFFERKNSFKSPRSSVNSTISGSTLSLPKVDQKMASRNESSTSIELKAVPTDSKLSFVPKTINHAPRRGAEGPAPSGDFKRQLSCLSNVVGAASANDISNSEQKHVDTSTKNDSSSNLLMAEDESPKPRESTNHERIKESSTNLPRQSNYVGVTSVACPKCKEIGHSAQFCSVDCPRSVGFDSSSSRSSREDVDVGNKLKAALEAAMLKKPTFYRKSRRPYQSDEMSVSSMNNETTSHDQLSSSSSMRSVHSIEVIEGQAMVQNTVGLSKQANGSTTPQFMAIPTEGFTPRSGDDSAVVHSDRKHYNIEFPSHASAAMSLLLQMSAIPDHEYSWQGSLEVHRSGRSPELWDGFQAHLSTCASPKVIDAVNKFPRKILFDEVPRVSAWPIQFQKDGAKEENIALYLFAREFESYERSYNILLERMMRSDLALRGSIDGVELLIFPSNQLPHKSQRWNMLFFLWGVFRGKRENYLPQGPVSTKKFCISPDMRDALVSLPEKLHSLGSTNNNVPVPDRAGVVVTATPVYIEFPSSSVGTNRELQEPEPHSNSSSFTEINLDHPMPMMAGNVNADSEPDRGVQVSVQSASAVCSTNISMSEKVTFDLSVPHDSQQASANNIYKVPADAKDMAYFSNVNKRNVAVQNNMNSSRDLGCSRNVVAEEESLVAEAAMEKEMVLGVQITGEVNNWQLDHRKQPFVGPTEKVSEAVYAGTSQTKLWNDVNNPAGDGGKASKKQKIGPYEWNDFNANHLGDDVASRMNDGDSSSRIKGEGQFDTPSQETATNPIDLENNGERFFFPVDPRRMGKGDNSIPWIGSLPSKEEEMDKCQDRIPNLELALGAEMKPSRQLMQPTLVGKIDINLDEQPLDTEEEEDTSAALSLSLSFPGMGVPAAASEQPLPRKQHVNPSVLLLGGFSDK